MPSILDNPVVRRAALPISVAQYHLLGNAGIIGQNTELIQGVILKKMIKSPQHSWLVQFLANLLRDAVSGDYHVRQEQPLTLIDSEPEPDIAIVSGQPADYRTSHPSTAVVVMEVAISSLEVDREKAEVYAEAGVAEYWLIIPQQNTVQVYTIPRSGGYEKRDSYGPQQTLNLVGFPNVAVDLSRIIQD